MGLRKKDKMIELPFEMGDMVKTKDGRTGQVRLNFITEKKSRVLFQDKSWKDIPWKDLTEA